MSFKSLFMVLLAFCIGTGVGMSIMRPLTVPGNAFDPAFRDKMQALASSDLEEYYRLKTAEEKYQKADEILGKIIQVFLADLALHISGPTQEAAKSGARPELPRVSAAPAIACPPCREIPKTAEAPQTKTWREAENKIINARNDRDIPTLLEEARFPDFYAALKQTTLFKNQSNALNTITGNFAGTAEVTTNGKARIWEVKMRLTGVMARDKLNGQTQIEMYENGKRFSNLTGTGNLDAFREFTGNYSQALLVKASPDEFFQLFQVRDLNRFVGNVYQRGKDEEGGFVHIGTITLRRQ